MLTKLGYCKTIKIIGEDLFGEIGELINFTQISSHQMKKYGPRQMDRQTDGQTDGRGHCNISRPGPSAPREITRKNNG